MTAPRKDVIGELRGLLEKAFFWRITERPLRVEADGYATVRISQSGPIVARMCAVAPEKIEDERPETVPSNERMAAAIVAAMNALPALLDELETMRGDAREMAKHWAQSGNGPATACAFCQSEAPFADDVTHSLDCLAAKYLEAVK